MGHWLDTWLRSWSIRLLYCRPRFNRADLSAKMAQPGTLNAHTTTISGCPVWQICPVEPWTTVQYSIHESHWPIGHQETCHKFLWTRTSWKVKKSKRDLESKKLKVDSQIHFQGWSTKKLFLFRKVEKKKGYIFLIWLWQQSTNLCSKPIGTEIFDRIRWHLATANSHIEEDLPVRSGVSIYGMGLL